MQEAFRAGGRDVSQPLLSRHLRVLRQAGPVTTARRATEITYHLAGGHAARDAIRYSREDQS